MYAARSRAVSAPRFTEVDMEVIAIHLQESLEEVERVFVFGGTGDSSGTIVMITADRNLMENFILFSSKCNSNPEFEGMFADKVRFEAFEQTYPRFALWRKKHLHSSPFGAYFDVLICLPDWQKRIKELEVNYYHPVPNYLLQMSKREPLFVA